MKIEKFNHLELAWAAGFFDGEGCITNYISGKKIRSRIFVTQCGSFAVEILTRFNKAIFGLGNICECKDRAKDEYKRKTKYRLFVNPFEYMQFVVCCLWPYLSKAKKEQIKLCFSKAKE